MDSSQTMLITPFLRKVMKENYDALIERLRNDPVWCMNNAEEIASAIAELRDENMNLQKNLDTWEGMDKAKIKVLEAEIAKLRERVKELEGLKYGYEIRHQLNVAEAQLSICREALEGIANHEYSTFGPGLPAYKVARAALEKIASHDVAP